MFFWSLSLSFTPPVAQEHCAKFGMSAPDRDRDFSDTASTAPGTGHRGDSWGAYRPMGAPPAYHEGPLRARVLEERYVDRISEIVMCRDGPRGAVMQGWWGWERAARDVSAFGNARVRAVAVSCFRPFPLRVARALDRRLVEDAVDDLREHREAVDGAGPQVGLGPASRLLRRAPGAFFSRSVREKPVIFSASRKNSVYFS